MAGGKWKNLTSKVVDGFLSGGAIGGIIDAVTGFIPNKNDRAAAREAINEKELELRVRELMLKGDLEKTIIECVTEENLMQMQINLADAKSGDKFQAWWRPACGWAGVVALVWSSVGYSMYTSFAPSMESVPPDTQFVQLVLLGMLGLRGGEKYLAGKNNNNAEIAELRRELEVLRAIIEELKQMLEPAVHSGPA